MIFVNPVDTNEIGVKFGVAINLGWKGDWSKFEINVDGLNRICIEYIQSEILVNNLINRLNNQSECNLIVLD